MLSRRNFLRCGCASLLLRAEFADAGSVPTIRKLPANVVLKKPLCRAGLSAEIYNGKNLVTVDQAISPQFAQQWSLVASAMSQNPLLAFVQDKPDQVLIRTYSYDEPKKPVVVFGLNSLSKIQEAKDFAHEIMVGCLAHEFGHAVQFSSQCLVNLNIGPQGNPYKKGACMTNLRLPKNDSPFMSELHADFLSGWVLGREKLLTKNFQGFSRFLFGLGDTFFGTSHHHGTPRQRLNAMAAGWAFGNSGRVVGTNTGPLLKSLKITPDHQRFQSAFDIGQIILADYLGGCTTDECNF